MARLKNGITLNKAKVIVDLLGKGAVVTGQRCSATEIAVHNTGNWDVPSKNYNSSIKQNNQGKGRDASWHFTVDDKEIYQHMDTTLKAWHVGSGNSVAIGIEICMFKDANRQKLAEDNAIALIKELQKIHNIPLSKVKMHKDYTGKYCPEIIIKRDGNLNKFKDRITKWNTSTPSKPTGNIPPNGDIQRKGKVVVSSLNVRSGRGTNYSVIGKLKKGDVVELYYCLNGWSSMNSKFKDSKGKPVNNFVCVANEDGKYIEIL